MRSPRPRFQFSLLALFCWTLALSIFFGLAKVPWPMNAYEAPLYAAVTKFHAQIDTLEQIPHLMRQAFREATTGTPRPVHLDMAGLTGDAITSLEEPSTSSPTKRTHVSPRFAPPPIRPSCRRRQRPSRLLRAR
jgi:hypothetical protein